MKIIDADKLHYKQVYIQTEKGLRPALVVFAKEIRKMPEIPKTKAQVDPIKHGHWRTVTLPSYMFEGYRCSQCAELVYGRTKYCPQCGAKMDEVKKNDSI